MQSTVRKLCCALLLATLVACGRSNAGVLPDALPRGRPSEAGLADAGSEGVRSRADAAASRVPQGIYEECRPSDSTCPPHLDQMAAAGFELVLNYDSLFGHMSDIVAYIDHAHSLGMQVILSLADPAVWNGTSFAKYDLLSADSGCADGDDACLTTYVVNHVSGLPGLWGYYVGDELCPCDLTQLEAHANLIHSLDPAHPRLYVGSATGCVHVWDGTSPFYQVADVIGDDFYPVGYACYTVAQTAMIASGIQSYCDTHKVGSTIVLQAFSETEYGSMECSPYPACAPFPTYAQMKQQRDLALANMTPRLLLWYSYWDVMRSSDPTGNWNALVSAAFGP